MAEDAPAEDARVRIYRLERQRFEELHRWVSDVEVFWTAQLGSFKAHAERTRGDQARRSTKRTRSPRTSEDG